MLLLCDEGVSLCDERVLLLCDEGVLLCDEGCCWCVMRGVVVV